MHIEWWVWICVGIILLLAEAMTPGGFYLFFIGLAAMLAGVSAVFIDSALVQIIIYIVLLTLLLSLFRKKLVERVRKSTPQADTPEFVGETAKAVENIAVGQQGKVELRGSIWQGHNAGPTDLQVGSVCIIIARNGLQMTIAPKP